MAKIWQKIAIMTVSRDVKNLALIAVEHSKRLDIHWV